MLEWILDFLEWVVYVTSAKMVVFGILILPVVIIFRSFSKKKNAKTEAIGEGRDTCGDGK